MRSNELYPAPDGKTRRERGVRFIDADGAVNWLTLGEGGGLSTFHDVIRPEREVDYALRFLPPDDAFYSFQGYLGERRWLPGRDRPLGADYDTLPPLKPLPHQLVAFAWRPGHPKDLRRRLALAEPDSGGERFRALAADFADTVAVARSDRITQLRAPGIIAGGPP